MSKHLEGGHIFRGVQTYIWVFLTPFLKENNHNKLGLSCAKLDLVKEGLVRLACQSWGDLNPSLRLSLAKLWQ